MSSLKNPDETTLLIKLPPELKASFQGLCKFRGVSVSAELRRFMADEVANTAHGMTTRDKSLPKKPSHARVPIPTSTPAVVPKKSFKDAVQAELVLPSATQSAINASNKRKNNKKRKK